MRDSLPKQLLGDLAGSATIYKTSAGWELLAHSRNCSEHRSADNCGNIWKRRNIGNACTHDNYKTMVTLLTNVSINVFSS